MSHYKHLTIEERESLYLRKNQGESIRAIARALGRSASTISRELSRNKTCHRPYSPSRAQNRYARSKKKCGRKAILRDETPRDVIRKLLLEDWSPEQIQHRLAFEENEVQISFATIYRALHQGILDEPSKHYILQRDRYSFHLRQKGKKRKKGTESKRGKFQIEHTIDQRPASANDRTEIGHWEGDTVAGKKGGACLLTQVDRKARYLLAAKVSDASSESVKDAMISLFKGLPESKVLSITPDRGHEFAQYKAVTESVHQVPFYFADPYSPWQRGTNENTNGLLRQYFPKYSSLDDLTDADLDAVVDKINHRPRKCLGWLSPFEVFFNTLLHLT